MSALPPRAVIVTRQTELTALLERHATLGQVAFFLDSRGEALAPVEARHALQVEALKAARAAIPADWSMAQVERSQLDRFQFSARDVVVCLGQDGLVANVAKYLDGQPVIGTPVDAARNSGVLTRTPLPRLAELCPAVAARQVRLEPRTMARAQLSDGQSLLALNEIFIGHETHQSARYLIRHADREEHHSSSGVIVSTGTGLSGWARSILAATGARADLEPTDTALFFMAREPWPSAFTGTELRHGRVDREAPLSLRSRLDEGGVIFADGIESDALGFGWGTRVDVRAAAQTLNLVAET